MPETPKRLTPTKETIRDLAAHSGNVCAYPGCNHAIIDGEGRLIAQLCHIAAAEPGGERFDPDMTNEERRSRDNLVFLCLRHHVATNDMAAWSIARMKQMKSDHERKFRDRPFEIPDVAIRDITKSLEPGRPQTLKRFGAHLNAEASKPEFEISPEQLLEDIDGRIAPLIDRLRKLSPDTRALLSIVIERGEPYRDDLGAPATEIEQVTRMGPRRVKSHVGTMERYGLAFLDESWYDTWWIGTSALDGWAFWRDVKAFCEATGIDVAEIVVNLRFDLLD